MQQPHHRTGQDVSWWRRHEPYLWAGTIVIVGVVIWLFGWVIG
jgi:hypothetical protein